MASPSFQPNFKGVKAYNVSFEEKKLDLYEIRFVWIRFVWIHNTRCFPGGGGGGGTPHKGLYGEAPPERGTFFGLQVLKG